MDLTAPTGIKANAGVSHETKNMEAKSPVRTEKHELIL